MSRKPTGYTTVLKMLQIMTERGWSSAMRLYGRRFIARNIRRSRRSVIW